jgi:hypothetical protein
MAPSRFRIDDPVIAAFKRHKPCVRNERRESAALLKWYSSVTTRVEYERGTLNLFRSLAEIDVMIRAQTFDGDLRAGRDPHQVVERPELLRRCIRNEE